NLNSERYISFFLAGSVPEVLEPKADLDFFFVIPGNQREEFFGELTGLMNKFLEGEEEVIYSFFRGPIKFEDKGLIHFLVYTDESYDENGSMFTSERLPVLKGLLGNAKVISGKSFDELLESFDFEDSERVKTDLKKGESKYEILKEKGTVNYPEWKKTAEGWKFMRTELKVEGFLKEYLLGYFGKRK
ncbi:MAG: hypothetical protein KC506_03905, partial [Nanoarchaeota archaeon]|nr:hypothetical protein [Nanoarchaeota archaeon]